MDGLLEGENQAAAAMYYLVQYIQKGSVVELQGRVHPHVHHVSCSKALKPAEVRVG